MAKTDLKMYSTDASDKKITTTLTYVNPAADSTTLKQFATKLNAFTTNTYGETDRVQTINVDTEEVPTPPIELEEYEITAVDFDQSKLTTDHTAIVAKITTSTTAPVGYGGTFIRAAVIGATKGTYGAYVDTATGNIHLVTSPGFVRADTTLQIIAKFVRPESNYAVKSSTVEIPLTAS